MNGGMESFVSFCTTGTIKSLVWFALKSSIQANLVLSIDEYFIKHKLFSSHCASMFFFMDMITTKSMSIHSTLINSILPYSYESLIKYAFNLICTSALTYMAYDYIGYVKNITKHIKKYINNNPKHRDNNIKAVKYSLGLILSYLLDMYFVSTKNVNNVVPKIITGQVMSYMKSYQPGRYLYNNLPIVKYGAILILFNGMIALYQNKREKDIRELLSGNEKLANNKPMSTVIKDMSHALIGIYMVYQHTPSMLIVIPLIHNIFQKLKKNHKHPGTSINHLYDALNRGMQNVVYLTYASYVTSNILTKIFEGKINILTKDNTCNLFALLQNNKLALFGSVYALFNICINAPHISKIWIFNNSLKSNYDDISKKEESVLQSNKLDKYLIGSYSQLSTFKQLYLKYCPSFVNKFYNYNFKMTELLLHEYTNAVDNIFNTNIKYIKDVANKLPDQSKKLYLINSFYKALYASILNILPAVSYLFGVTHIFILIPQLATDNILHNLSNYPYGSIFYIGLAYVIASTIIEFIVQECQSRYNVIGQKMDNMIQKCNLDSNPSDLQTSYNKQKNTFDKSINVTSKFFAHCMVAGLYSPYFLCASLLTTYIVRKFYQSIDKDQSYFFFNIQRYNSQNRI